MILCFTLTMPRVNTWNGSWSGDGKQYSICRSFRTNEMKEKVASILQKENYFYDFGDGWTARVEVKEVADRNEANRIKRKSAGFYGYDWMIESIVNHGVIKPNDRKETTQSE